VKTVVTGGTGFIGSHLVKRLVDEGREVIVTSDLSRLGSENLSGLDIKPSDIELRGVDLSDYRQALKAVEGADTLFHLAARVGSVEYLHGTEMSELAALQTNLVIDANTFRACLERNVKKLIYASSCAVYPMARQYSLGAVFSEDDLELQPEVPVSMSPDGGYGWAKLIGEIEVGWMKDIDIGIARIFNIYGENEPLTERAHVLCDLIRKAILYPKEEFIVWGSGEQTRDFLYVSDCVEALLKLEDKASNPPIIVNSGSGQAMPIKVIAQKIARLSGKKPEALFDPTKPVGPVSRTADITRARALLNWQPKVSLDDGLRHTYAWVEKRLKREGIC
jgi:nucleoside-diphosphate-sugar epimerase